MYDFPLKFVGVLMSEILFLPEMSSSRGSYNPKSVEHGKGTLDSSRINRKYGTKKCGCGRRVLILTSHTPQNDDRDFYRCQYWKVLLV